MKKILIGIVAVIAVAIVAVFGMAMTRPDAVHVERSVTVAATPDDVFVYTNDLGKMDQWSPWAKLDPDQKVEVSDPSAGVGATYYWKGNDQVGEGRMTITESSVEKVAMKLEFIAPWEGVSEVSLLATPVGDDQTKVTWTYDQQADLMAKVMGVFMDMDAMLGADYEKGLASMKPLIEQTAKERQEAEAAAKAAEEAAAAAQASAETDAAAAPAPTAKKAAPAAMPKKR